MLRRLAPFAADLIQHRELLWQFIVRNVELRHKGSHLGLVWAVLNPLLMLGLYVLVFGYIFGGRFGVLPDESRWDYAIGVFIGLSLFHFFAEVMATAPATIVSNPNFVKKVVFPVEILPAASVGSALFHLAISLTLALAGLVLSGRALTPSLFWLPVFVLPLALLGLGVAWLFSALGVFFRDIGQVMQFITLALMYASAVFFSAAMIPAEIWTFLRFNPLLLAIELARNSALWAQAVNFNHLAYLYAIGLFFCWAGHAFFRRTRLAFADVL